ncbi:MAG: endoribonuclease MazF [Actinobacteria bacterium]|nr:endoribonuclease MazF [Actinomycetota bacterium]
MAKDFAPAAGDILWLSLDPTQGHEQAGHRPVLVLSDKRYNQLTGMMICCPITSQPKGYPFEVSINTAKAKGVVLADQPKSLDWRARGVSKAVGTADSKTLVAVRLLTGKVLGL